MATRSWANRPHGIAEQVAGRSWANRAGSGAHENQAAAVASPDEDAGLFIAGQQQPVIKRAGMIPY